MADWGEMVITMSEPINVLYDIRYFDTRQTIFNKMQILGEIVQNELGALSVKITR